MEWNILFMGPVGAGKTRAIRTISDIEVVNTDEQATDETQYLKQNTTVSMDVGALQLMGADKLRLLGSPGQDRFDFMWDILLEQAKGVVLVIDHSREDPVADLRHFMTAIDQRTVGRALPLVIGVSHFDLAPQRPMSDYQDYLTQRVAKGTGVMPPVIEMDARDNRQVRVALIAMTALLEMFERFPKVASHGDGR